MRALAHSLGIIKWMSHTTLKTLETSLQKTLVVLDLNGDESRRSTEVMAESSPVTKVQTSDKDSSFARRCGALLPIFRSRPLS